MVVKASEVVYTGQYVATRAISVANLQKISCTGAYLLLEKTGLLELMIICSKSAHFRWPPKVSWMRFMSPSKFKMRIYNYAIQVTRSHVGAKFASAFWQTKIARKSAPLGRLCLNSRLGFIPDFMEITDTRRIYLWAFSRQNFENRHFVTRERTRLKCLETKETG